jgi:DNA-binding transcriptional regulator YiaG
MRIDLHKIATTTRAIRSAIEKARGSDDELAERFGASRVTVRNWRKREGVLDASHTPHRL